MVKDPDDQFGRLDQALLWEYGRFVSGIAFQQEAQNSLALYLERKTEQPSLSQTRFFPPPYVFEALPSGTMGPPEIVFVVIASL